MTFGSSRTTTSKDVQGNYRSSITAPVAAFLLIAQQFGSRCLTFFANQILLRYLSPELLGASAQLELYSITVLFFSRESLRVSLQRQTEAVDATEVVRDTPKGYIDGRSLAGRTQAVVNLAYVSLSIGVLAVFGFALLYLTILGVGDEAVARIPYFKCSLVLYGVASMFELLAEPCYAVVQQRSRQGIRAASESIATLMRCLVTCASTISAFQTSTDIGVLSFALGQLAYSSSLLAVYYWKVIVFSSHQGFSLWPKPIYSSNTEVEAFAFSYFSRPALSLARSFFVQSIFKHALTQGDMIIISALSSPGVQGVYALANNYGSLVARLVLQPVEDVSRNYFGKMLSSSRELSQATIFKARTSLLQLLHSYLIISIIVTSVGPTMAPSLFKIIAGSQWAESEAGDVLATFCYYIPLLAINGLTEAFVSCVASESEVHRQTAWMVVFSVAFAGSAFLFLSVWQLGPQGLVYANSLNMLLRVIWATNFIHSYLARWKVAIDFRILMPRIESITAGVGASAILTKLEKNPDGSLLDVLKTSAIAGILLIIM